jgi:hypothetical protein
VGKSIAYPEWMHGHANVLASMRARKICNVERHAWLISPHRLIALAFCMFDWRVQFPRMSHPSIHNSIALAFSHLMVVIIPSSGKVDGEIRQSMLPHARLLDDDDTRDPKLVLAAIGVIQDLQTETQLQS